EIDACCVDAEFGGGGRHRRDSVVGSKGQPHVAESARDVFVQPCGEGAEVGVYGVDHGLLLGRVGTDLVAEDIGWRDADNEQVRRGAGAKRFAGDEGLGKVEFVADPGGGGTHVVVEVLGADGIGFLLGLINAPAVVKAFGPVGQLRHVEAGSDESSGCGIDPEGAVGGGSSGEDGSGGFEGDAPNLRLAGGVEAEFVAYGGGKQVEGRGSGGGFGSGGQADERVALILNGADALLVAAGEVPPGVAADSVAVGVGSGGNGCVAGGGLGVGVVVIAVGKPGSVVEEEIEATLVF